MKPAARIASLFLFALSAAPVALHADADGEKRLREQLRQTMLQLRQLQDQNSELQVKLAGAQSAPAKTVAAAPSRAEIDKVRAQARQEAKQETAQLQSDLDAARNESAGLRQQLDAARTELASAKAVATAGAEAQKRVADTDRRSAICQQQNLELADISAELLQRWHDKGVWQALWQAEPFTGIARARFEQVIESYRGRIIDASLGPADRDPVAGRARGNTVVTTGRQGNR